MFITYFAARMSVPFRWLWLFAVLTTAGAQTQYKIDTFAGSSIPDGAPALNVALLPRSVAFNPSGVLHISALNVYRLGADGNLTTAAGTTMNYSGDGGPANQATIWDPQSVAFDAAGNLYIADTGNSAIRKVDAATGVISTIAGTSFPGNSGDGGPAVKAQLNLPSGVVVDPSGTLYFSDSAPPVIRKVVLSTGIISTVPGVFSAVRNSNPRGIALDGAGNLYVADRGSHKILKVALATNTTSIFSGGTQGFSGDGGTPDKAQFSSPQSVSVDGAGNLYIADNGNRRIRKISADLKTVSTVAGTGVQGAGGDGGPAAIAQLSDVFWVTADAGGNVYAADTDNGKVRMIGGDGVINTIAGGSGGDGGPALQSQFVFPALLSTDPDGGLYVTELNRVRKVDSSGAISTVAGNGTTGFSGDKGPAVNASLGLFPNGTALDSAGSLYITDSSNAVVRKVDRSTGVITTVVGDFNKQCAPVVSGAPAVSSSLCLPQAVAFDASGNMYISDYIESQVYAVSAADGTIKPVAGLGLDSPTCLYIDQAGGDLYVCDYGHSTVVRLNLASGVVKTVAGVKNSSGFGLDGGPATATKLDGPQALAMDSAGNLLIADQYNNRICLVDRNGILKTIAGTGDLGYSGDGGSAVDALLNGPDGLAVDAAGNIYIAEYFNHAVRVLRPVQGQPTSSSRTPPRMGAARSSASRLVGRHPSKSVR